MKESLGRPGLAWWTAGLVLTAGCAGAPGVVAVTQDAGEGSAADAGVDAGSGRRDAGQDAGPAPVTVVVFPSAPFLAFGQGQLFTASVSGSANGAVTWSVREQDGGTITSSGAYTAPQEEGVFQVVARSEADPAQTATAQVTVHAQAYPSLSGSVSYPGARTGRLFINVYNVTRETWVAGTSVSFSGSPAGFMVRGIDAPNGDNLRVEAFLDTRDLGARAFYLDPGGAASVTATGANLAGVAVTLTDPEPVPVPDAGVERVVPVNGAAVVRYGRATNDAGLEVAEAYRLYWSTLPSPGPGNTQDGGSRTVFAYLDNLAVAAPMEPGLPYYVGVAAVVAGQEGQVSSTSLPVPASEPSGGFRVSGSATFFLGGQSGALYAGVYAEELAQRATRLVPSSSPQPFSISGVPPGSWRLFSFLDVGDDGFLGPRDPRRFEGGPPLQITHSVVAQSVALPGSLAVAQVRVERHLGVGQSSPAWAAVVQVRPNLELPIRVVMQGGPGSHPPQDVPLRVGEHALRVPLSGRPARPYLLDVAYGDGSAQRLTTPSPAAVDFVPDPTGPSGPGASPTPLFTWGAPLAPPAYFRYVLRLEDASGATLWYRPGIDGTATSVPYNDDGKATAVSLPSGQGFKWVLTMEDLAGNRSSRELEFSRP